VTVFSGGIVVARSQITEQKRRNRHLAGSFSNSSE
jgi:hypothetical protein